jgi:hypothetical protein
MSCVLHVCYVVSMCRMCYVHSIYQSFGCVVVFFVSKVLCVFMQVLCLVCEFLVFFMQHQILDVLHIMCLCLACVECLVKNKTKQTNNLPSLLERPRNIKITSEQLSSDTTLELNVKPSWHEKKFKSDCTNFLHLDEHNNFHVNCIAFASWILESGSLKS